MKVMRLLKSVFFSATIFVCAQALWAQPELVVQEWHNISYLDQDVSSTDISVRFNGVSSDGRYLLTSSMEDIKLWDVKLACLIRTFSNVQYPREVKITPDGGYFVYQVGNDIAFCDLKTDERRYWDKNFSTNGGRIGFAFSSDGSYLAAFLQENSSTRDITIYDGKSRDKKVIKVPKTLKGSYRGAWFSADNKYLIVATMDQNTVVCDVQTMTSEIQSGSAVIDWHKEFCFFKDVKYSPKYAYVGVKVNRDGVEINGKNAKAPFVKRIFWDKSSETLFTFGDVLKNEKYLSFDNNFSYKETKLDAFDTSKLESYMSAFSISENKNVLSYLDKDWKVRVYKEGGGKLLTKFSHDRFEWFEVSPCGNFVFSQNFDFGKKSRVYDCNRDKLIKLDGNIQCVSSDDKYFVVVSKSKTYGSGIIQIYDTSSWKVIRSVETKDLGMWPHAKYPSNSFEQFKISLSKDANRIIVWCYDTICLYDFSTGKIIGSIKNKSYKNIKEILCFINNTDNFIIFDGSDVIRCYSISGELICALIANVISGDWITYTPEGYFNGSEGGIKSFVHVVDGLKVYPLDQLAEVFFRPDLVAAKIAGKDVSKAAVADLPKPKEKTADQDSALQTVLATGEPPLVQFANPPSSSAAREVQLKFNVLDQGGGIGGVFISVNGKVVQLSGSTKKIEAVSKEKGVPFSPLVSLCAGENVIEAYATNSAGKIESRRDVAKITWKGDEEKPNLHILALGVNDYATTGVSKLKYAVPDAQSVVQKFSQKSGGALYGRVWTKALLDKDVTKPNIQACVDSMAKNVKADDVFVLYISGHGVSYQGDYYFISYDFDGKNISTAVSKDFLLNNCLSKIKASKTLLLLDTCNSGAIVSGGDSDTAFARLSRATGQAIIAASSDTQTAIEGYDGHGVFTYALLDALSGKADFVGDNKISLLELNLYVSNIVPMLSKLKWNHAQNPWYDLRKQDFVLLDK